MQVNGALISEEEVIAYLPRIYKLCEEHDIPATFFEITTALAFLYFAEQNVDVVVLETGLGGRLDSTNVIAAPALSVITSIGLEHTRILGDTVEEIAVEKGGIIKAGRPVLVGPHVPHEVLRQCAMDKNASAYFTCDDVLGESSSVITDYDEENARIATAAVKLLEKYNVPDDIVKRGTLSRPPCRFEILEVDGLTAILDVAHNPPAMKYLVRKLEATYPNDKYRMVVGMSSDKDLGQCARSILEAVKDNVKAIHLVQAAHPRAATIEAILAAESSLNGCHWNDKDRSIAKQVREAMQLAKDNNEILVLCGSVFLMSEAREALGIDEPRDSKVIAEVAGAGSRHGQENFGNTDPEADPSR
jgi:dihydrofolate synthase/folylpolyglutamate synthase